MRVLTRMLQATEPCKVDAETACELMGFGRAKNDNDAAQDRGEVARPGGERSGREHSTLAPTAADIGISRKDIHEARIIREDKTR